MKHLKFQLPLCRLAVSLLMAATLGACSGQKPEAMLASARDYMAKNDPKAAIIQAKNVLQDNPESPEARYLLGWALVRSGDPVGGETELRRALKFKHPDDQVVPPLVQAMLAQGQHKKVIEEFSSQQLSDPKANAEFQTGLWTAYSVDRNPDKAKAALAMALAADPTYVPALIAQARGQAAAGDFDGALAAVDAMLTKTPTDHDALMLKGDVLRFGKNDADAAMVVYRKVVEAKPDLLAAHFSILDLLVRKSDYDAASKQLTAVKLVAANHGMTRYFDTLLAFQKKDYTRARELSQQLIRVASENAQALALAGAIELQLNSLVQAESYLNKALQAAPQAVLTRRMLASTYMRTGQTDKALATLQPLLKGTDVDAATNAMAGEIYLRQGDVKTAESYFAKSTKQDPKNARARTALAITHLAGGIETGLAELQEVAAADSGASADLAIITVHLRRNEFDKALNAIAALEKKQPDKPLASHLRGRTLLAKKDTNGARKAFEQSVTIDPTYFPSVAALAAIDMADQKPDAARKRFEAVLAKDPKSAQALLALAELKARSGGAKEEVADLISKAVAANPTNKGARLLQVDFHLRNKDYKLALSAAQNAVAAITDSPELVDALGRAQLLSGDGSQAMASFKKMSDMQPQSPLPHMRIADVHMVAKNKVAAAQSLRKALELQPNRIEAQRGLIFLALDDKKPQEALRIARDVQKQRPKESLGFEFEGDIAAGQTQWDGAIASYRAALKLGGASGMAIKLYSALGLAGKTVDQDGFANNWLKEHPKDVTMRLFLGDGSLVRKDFAAGEKYYASVLQIEPNNAVALNNMAWVTNQLKKDGAIEYSEKALALSPGQPAFMDTLAMILSDKGDYAKALEWQTKAVAKQPENGVYKLNLAKIHIKGGNKDLARKQLDELANLGDKFPGQAQVTELRKSL